MAEIGFYHLTRTRLEQALPALLGRTLAAGERAVVLCGSAERVADTLEEWFTTGAADGFNIMPAWFPGGFAAFTGLVVPILQARGWFRRAYPGKTLRDTLGLERPGRG